MLDNLTELPEGWEETTLGDIILSITYGHTASATDQPIGPKFLRITDLQNNSVNWENVPYCECKESEKYQLKVGDIVVARTGATTGKSYLIQDLPEPTVFASYLIRLQTSLLCSVEYLAIFMQSDNYWEQITTVSKGTAQPGANASILATLTIPLPPLNEQKRIVAKIEELRSHTQAARNAIAHIPKLLEQFRQSVLAAAFRGDLTAEWRSENPDVEPAEFLLKRIHTNQISNRKKGKRSREAVANIRAEQVDFKDCPNIWKVIQLGDICQLQTGYAFKSSQFTPDGIRLLRGVNVAPSNIRWDDVVCISRQQATEFQDYELFENDLVIAMDRPVISTGLKIARLKLQDLPSLLLQRVGRFKLEPEVDADFIFTYLSSHIFLSHIQGQATGTQLPHISASDIETAVIPFLPIEEQKEIVKQIKLAFEKIDRIEQQYQFIKTELDRLDRSILAKAFKGELVLQDPTDEPAIVLLERIRTDRASQVKPAKTKRSKNRE